ncbi:hemagglutinin repeat-containing protein [Bisgaard Taxon 10/6]|nr:hemagglutinin repeat-containing protein [Exercitatus varius]
MGKGRENSDTVTQVNTHITGSQVSLHSGQDTALRGAVVNAGRLEADIGGNLTIESRQDSNRYDSKQSQANAGGSVAVYGSGSNAYAGTSLTKGKVNYAQVEEQSGLTVGKEGMDVNVRGNTHLKGGLIQSTAPTTNNRFRSGSLTGEDIENHSEISLQSLGGGISGDMFSGDMVGSLGKLGSANGWSAVVSALGGVNRDDKTLTRSAIGDNIALEIKTHEIPTALSRDTEHSNAKVQQYDKAEYEERLETAQLIGDISQNQIDIEWTPKVREAEANRQQAEAVLNNQNATTAEKAEARQIKSQSEQIIATYGKGGDYQMAVRAVTGVLQGLATGNQNAAWVNGLSPYANNLIKTYTTDESGQVNTTANLMAHAMLGALEAYATGNHAAAGAAGAITSEVAAKLITEQLYHTEPDKLTDDQKQVVATLSQVTAGLAGVVIADSTQSAVSTAEIGKRAVENNYLFKEEVVELNRLRKEYSECVNNGGLNCQAIKDKEVEIVKLDEQRDRNLAQACYSGMTSGCAKELITLEQAFRSYDSPDIEIKDPVTRSEYLDVSQKFGEKRREYMEDVAKEALQKITVDTITDGAELIAITAKAVGGDEEAQQQVRAMGNAIVEFAKSPVETISTEVSTKLTEAEQLEAQGRIREADLVRMEVYLSGELGVISTVSGIAKAVPKIAKLGLDGVGKLTLKKGVLSNKEVKIEWGPIQKQGKAWESYLQTILPEGTIDLNSIKPNFKAFDHLLPDGTAISAKTMDTVGGYKDPRRITSQLNKYVDDMVKFQQDGKRGGRVISNEQILSKEMYLAIPYGTSKEKIQAINKSVDYAKIQGVKLIVKEIK